MAGRAAQAREAFEASLEISRHIEDPRGLAEARLWLAEADLSLGRTREAEELYTALSPEIERAANLPLIGRLRELAGRLATECGDFAEAVRRFNQAVSIWEMSGDCYHGASAGIQLALAQARTGDLAAARESLRQSRAACKKIGARPLLARVEEARQSLDAERTAASADASSRIISAQTRLLEAEVSPELLMHETARILHHEFAASPVVIFQREEGRAAEPLAWQGYDEEGARRLGQSLRRRKWGEGGEVHEVDCGEAGRLALWLGSRGDLSESLLTLFLKQLKSGLERCRWRPRHVRAAAQDLATPAPQSLALPGMIHRSEAMRRVVEQVHSLCSSDITVLITGESGTGKELVARAIHALSSRAAAPFVPFNCAAMPRELIESHLFGHRRGAFTGAGSGSPGVIGAAAGGTLFLDEVGEMAREVQPKLLRFLQDGEIQRLGETLPRRVDVRVIAATNCNLEEMVAAGEFRADLYYRLNVIQFHLPPLRERREEIPLLVEHFLARYAAQTGRDGISFDPAAMELLKYYDWPGNARQLENEIYRLVALTPTGGRITADLLSPHIAARTGGRRAGAVHVSPSLITLADALAQVKRQLISDSLARHKGNLSKVADELGVSRFGLRKMLSHLQLSRPQG